jgi:hypothetical protein
MRLGEKGCHGHNLFSASAKSMWQLVARVSVARVSEQGVSGGAHSRSNQHTAALARTIRLGLTKKDGPNVNMPYIDLFPKKWMCHVGAIGFVHPISMRL